MDISRSTVEELAMECMDLLKLCSTQGDETLHVRFQNRIPDFKLWCDGVGALARMHARLDWRFRDRNDDLIVIKGVLALFRRFLETYRRSAGSGEPVDEPLRNIDSILEDLALLALAIRQTGKNSRLEKADSKYKPGDHDDLWIHLQCLLFIRRDPAGLTSSCLNRQQHRLLEANLRRRNRFLQAEKQAGYLKQPVEPQAPTTTTEESRTANRTGDIPTTKVDVASKSGTKTPNAADAALPETSAEVKPPVPSASGHSASVPEDEKRLPPIRPRQRSPALEVPKTVITSITASASYPSVRVPEGLSSFMCPCCCQPLPRDYATSDSIWRKHLAQDIQPYTCIADDCPTAHTYYSTEADLARHLQDHHRQTWQCPLCDQSPAIFTTEESLRRHFLKGHRNLDMDEIPGLLSMSQQYGLGITACPICGESDTMDSPELITHTLEHMHQFSLLSLPWSTEKLDVSADDMWFNPTHYRLSWSPRVNEMDQRNGFEAVSVLVRLVSWLESDAVNISKCSADSEKSLEKKNQEKLTQISEYFSDMNRVYFADPTTTASVRGSASLESSDTGEAADADNADPDDLLAELGFADPRDEVLRVEIALGSELDDRVQWLMTNPDFLQWRDDTHSRLLWIEGDASQRKTRLLYDIRNELQLSLGDALVLFLPYQAAENNPAGTNEMMRGLIYLFVKKRPSLRLHVESERSLSGQAAFQGPDAAAVLTHLLITILEDPSLPNTYVIIDVFGEADNDFSKSLDLFVLKLTPSRVKWVIAGRRKDKLDDRPIPDRAKAVISIELPDAAEPTPTPSKDPIYPSMHMLDAPVPSLKRNPTKPLYYSVRYPVRSISVADYASTLERGSPEPYRGLDRVFRSYHKSAFPGRSRHFLPEGCIDALITDEFVIEELDPDLYLRPEVIPDMINLAEFVLGKARRLFLTVRLSGISGRGLIQVMKMFREVDFDDSSLPITKSNWSKVPFFGDENKHPRSPWTLKEVDDFCYHQWTVLVPVFHWMGGIMSLQAEHILPFTRNLFDETKGSFGLVHHLVIHPDHLVGSDSTMSDKGAEISVAVRDFIGSIGDADDEDRDGEIVKHWQHEVGIWENARSLNHPHIVFYIAAFQQGKGRHLMFEWADGGNLREYWQKNVKPSLSADLVQSVVVQLRGLADALKGLHSSGIRHGDIKPENILRFVESDPLSLGFLKLADLGSGEQRSAVRWNGTHKYDPPESILQPNVLRVRSRLSDTWAIGCVTMELIVWMLFGADDLKVLHDSIATRSGRFFDTEDLDGTPVARLSPVIAACIDGIEADGDLVGSRAILDLLQIVRTKLLVVHLPQDSAEVAFSENLNLDDDQDTADFSTRFERATAGDSCHQLDVIINQGTSKDYWCFGGRHTRARRRPMSATNDLAPANLESRCLKPEDKPDTGLAVSHFDYSHPQLNNVWEFPVENEFAHALLRAIGPIDMLPTSDRPSRLCGKCQGFNFWEPLFQIIDTFSELMSTASACDFCKMRLEVAQDLVVYKPESIRFHREDSMIYMDKGCRPVFSICRNADLPTPIPIQIGFPRLPFVASTTYFEILRQWIQHCDEDHQSCRPPDLPLERAYLPTRLIDVGAPDSTVIRLWETTTQVEARYVALSHLWGRGPVFSTNVSNIARHKAGIDIDVLPKTFRDAVRVTRELGLRYIWIDAICIVHGPSGDFIRETSHMEEIFGSAYCVLAATRADSQVDGFLGPQPERNYVTYEDDGQPKFSVCSFIDDFRQDVLESRLNTRGWVLQERALARRTIHFAGRQTYWECGGGVRCETLTKADNLAASILADPRFPEKLVSPTSRSGTVLACQDLYSRYSRMALSYPPDRPIAIAGLERRLIRSLKIQGAYGVLNDGGSLFRRTLLWRRGTEVPALRRIEFPVGMTVPSWSWMAYDGGVDYVEMPFGKTEWQADEISISPTAGDQADQAGRSHHLTALARGFYAQRIPTTMYDIIYDCPDRSISHEIQCIVIGRSERTGSAVDIRHYVLLVEAPESSGLRPVGFVERVGVASIPGTMIDLEGPGMSVKVC